MKSEIEGIIIELYNSLKPKLKGLFNIEISDGLCEINPSAYASCEKLTTPNLITFYPKHINNPDIEFIKGIFTHEIIHCIQDKYMTDKETEAYQRMNKLNFFYEKTN